MAADEGDLDLGLLGPVRARRGGIEIPLGSARRQAVVSVLALHVNHAVSREQLIAAVWGDAPPASATGNVYTYVSALRQALEPDRDRWAAGELLTSGGGTYCLHLPEESVDVFRFEARRELSKRHRATNDRAQELAALQAALAEWSGTALAGVPGPYAEAQRVRLAELRLACAERHAAVLLDLGRPAEAIAALGPEVQAHPLQEALHGLLMTALDATGRRSEALAVHDRLSTLLREQTGTEPSAPLRAVHRRILNGGTPAEPSQATAARSAAPGSGPRRPTLPHPPEGHRRPAESDEPLTDPDVLVGRDPEIAVLQRACAGVAAGKGRSVRIEGTPGMGKSALLNVALRHALPAGMRIGWGVGDMLSRRTPFGVLLECVESALATGPPSPALQGIFPVAAEALEAPGPHIIDRAAALVRQAAQEAPLVLVVDDLHRADAATLRVWRSLRTATAEAPLLLVAAVRPGADELAGMPVDDAMSLTALTDEESIALVHTQNPEVGDPLLPQILAEAGGNPYYLRNLARAGAADDGTPPPGDLVTAVQGHISMFEPETRHVLRTIAFLGDRAEPAEVAFAAELTIADMQATVAPAYTAGVLVESATTLAFQHPIMARILRDATPAALRVTLHRSYAEKLAAAGVAPDRVVTQLLAGPVPLDPGISHWLLERMDGLAVRAPASTVRLLQRIHSPHTLDQPTRMALTAWLARLLYGLRRTAVTEAGWVAARAQDPELEAEMRWIAACSYDRRGDHEAAAHIARMVLSTRKFPEPWLDRFRMLIARLRVHLPGDPTMPRQNRSTIVGEKVISPPGPAVSSG